MKLFRNKQTGDYYTEDKKFIIEKGAIGWNVYELVDRGTWEIYEYVFSTETLKQVKESI